MGKRPILVVSSSDDENGGCSVSANCNSSRSTVEQYVNRKKCKGSRRTSVSDNQLCKYENKEASFDGLFKDFDQDLQGYSVFLGEDNRKKNLASSWVDANELWVDKYSPRSLAELAVQRKKIEEVKRWLDERVRTSKEPLRSQALVIAGPAGAGKSATVNVIASQLGAEVCEWKTPTPTLWKEYMHTANSGIHYVSKLEEFETFVERVRKYPLLPLNSKDEPRRPVILLIDDLPVTNGRVACGRLSKCLNILVQLTQIPTVILITEYGKAESYNLSTYPEELLISLEKAGACKVAFNPTTVNSLKKTLSRICREEPCNVSAESIDHIAKASGGDIRHAITSLQYFCLSPDVMPSLPSSVQSSNYLNGKSDELTAISYPSIYTEDIGGFRFSFLCGRDETLTLFHALGKFLHNKRAVMDTTVLGEDLFLLKDRFKRCPLKMDCPETVLSQAHGQARTIADFLHENVLDFLSDEAVEDAWVVASYLTDADCLLASLHGKHDLVNVAESVSASVAVRGVLFGNAHPSPSRWHSIRRPKLWQVEQSRRCNKNQLVLAKTGTYSGFSSSGMSIMATEYKPALKWLGYRSSDPQICKKLAPCEKIEVGGFCLMDQDGSKTDASSESEDDDIEDW